MQNGSSGVPSGSTVMVLDHLVAHDEELCRLGAGRLTVEMTADSANTMTLRLFSPTMETFVVPIAALQRASRSDLRRQAEWASWLVRACARGGERGSIQFRVDRHGTTPTRAFEIVTTWRGRA